MDNLKKISGLLMICCLLLTGCGQTNDSNIEGDLTDIMSDIYDGVKNVEWPILETVEVRENNIMNFLGTSDIDYKEGIASEPIIGSIPHSVVLLRMNEGADIEAEKEKIRKSVNPRKWVCVWVEDDEVIVDSRGDIIILIMVKDYSKKIDESFKNLD